MQSILLIGQSNMAGRGFLDTVPPIYNEHIKMLRNGRWQMMTEPIHFDREVAGVGPAASFAQQWAIDHPEETLGLIPCAEGGSSIEEWAPNGILMRHALSEARFASETSEIIGVLWHQGESDSREGKYKEYASKLKEVIQHVRQELGIADLPFIVGELGDYLGKVGFGLSSTEFAQINEAMQEAVMQTPNAYLVSAKGLTANPDGIHIDALSQRKFGLRYYHAFANQKNQETFVSDEDSWVERDAQREPSPNEKMYIQTLEFSKGKSTFEEFSQKMSEIFQSKGAE
ncbi:MAG: sialate O-acetylesterase [Enterococcus sp.]